MSRQSRSPLSEFAILMHLAAGHAEHGMVGKVNVR